ncbi:hypothetical protein [Ferrimonas senticii]|uniref:hypothetical protein n=1 Tax=Ferrimonas senticii TaxID=394566 RepID=UPI0004163CCD|nr:hypothetical protein [Ferrimonas senticii]
MTAPLLLVTDIFGQHQTLQPLIDELERHFSAVMVLDPYNGQRFVFDSETQAFEHFQSRCGAAGYQQKLQQILTSATAPFKLLAFSAGANAAWPLLTQANSISKAALVYGNAIVDQPELKPNCPTQLWLCDSDRGVKALQSQLNQHADLLLSPLPHGYFNPRSEHYQPVAATQDLQILIRYLLRN